MWVIFGLNASVAVLSFFVYGCQFEPVILCLIYCYLSSRISDSILKGGKKALKFEVVTKQADALAAVCCRSCITASPCCRRGACTLKSRGTC